MGGVLRFSLDHAWAQEAVRSGLDLGILEPTLAEMVALSVVRSAAGDRAEYHRRSDLERRLAGGTVLEPAAQGGVVIVVADGIGDGSELECRADDEGLGADAGRAVGGYRAGVDERGWTG